MFCLGGRGAICFCLGLRNVDSLRSCNQVSHPVLENKRRERTAYRIYPSSKQEQATSGRVRRKAYEVIKKRLARGAFLAGWRVSRLVFARSARLANARIPQRLVQAALPREGTRREVTLAVQYPTE